MTTTFNNKLDLTFERIVDVPPHLVWRAWTEPELMKQWFCPLPWKTIDAEVDVRPGGIFHYCLRTPTGFEMWGKWTFVDIVAPHTLSMVVAFSDTDEIAAFTAGHASMAQGCNASFEQLDAYLAQLPRP